MSNIFDLSLLVAVIIGVSELFKLYVNKKYIPILNMVTGLIAGVFYFDYDLKTNIMYGVVLGLTASGLFDISKVTKTTK